MTSDAIRKRQNTTLVTAGRDTKAQKGMSCNTPVVHGSTVLYPTAEEHCMP